jgi:hypothetical protein
MMNNGKVIEFQSRSDAAMKYAEWGYQVFPVWWVEDGVCACDKEQRCDRPSKHPITQHGLKDASTDKRQIAKWWNRYPEANIGIRTGPESGICVIDLDIGEDKDGVQSFLTLMRKQNGDIADVKTQFQRTGSGGMHLIFRYPENTTIKNLSTGLFYDGTLYSGIDVRGKDGYIIGAPSRNLKGEYQLYDAPVRDMPSWLIDVITTRQSMTSIDWNIINDDRFDDTYGIIASIWPNDNRHNFILGMASQMLRIGIPMRITEQVFMQCNRNVTGNNPHGETDLRRCVSDAYATGVSANFTALNESGLFAKINDAALRLHRIWHTTLTEPKHEKCVQNHDNIHWVPKSFFIDGEEIWEQTNAGYVVWDTVKREYHIADHFHTGEYRPRKSEKDQDKEVVYETLRDETLGRGQIILPDVPIETTGITQLIEDIEKKSRRWIYVAPEELPIFRVQIRVAIASWFLFVYDDIKIQERVAGLLGIVGTSGGGKKRWLTLLRMIAYRPIYLLNTQKIPSVYRLTKPWGTPTILIDEADQRDTGSEAEWVQFINSRYDGTPIPRYNAATGRVDIFDSFGLTAIALRRMPKDEGTTSRMTKINATISPIALPEVAGKDMYDDYEEIRNKLLYLRLQYYNRLAFVGSSGLPAEQSWRGKETLTLFRLLEQIDPEIDKDITEISKALTEREVQNLSGTWDGLIINEIYSFIVEENAEHREKNMAIYFIQKWKKEGKERITPLSLKYIADRLGTSASEVQRSMAQFKITTFDRFRIDGIDRPQRGVLMFTQLLDTDRIFQRYVVGYTHKLRDIDNLSQSSLDDIHKTETDHEKNPSGDHMADSDHSVPPVPHVPPHDLSRDLSNNNKPYMYMGGTSGTPGTEYKEKMVNNETSNPIQVEEIPAITYEYGETIREQLLSLGFLVDPNSGKDINERYYKLGILNMRRLSGEKLKQLAIVMEQEHFQKFTAGNETSITWYTRPLKK